MADQDIPLLDKEITRLPPEIREDLAAKGRSSLYFFAKAILGYSRLVPHAHGALCEFVDRNPSRFKMILMPRDHFKSSVVTIAGSLQRICKNPEERILIANENGTNASRFLGAIKTHAESNPVFRALYSDVVPKDFNKVRWNSSELTFNRRGHYPEPSIDSIGMTGTMTSRHYTHMTIDDPISEEAVKSPLVMQDTIARCHKVLSLMVEPKHDTFTLVGTRWAFADIYSDFLKKYKGQMAVFARAVVEDGEILFPELINDEMIALMRETYGPYVFSCLYMNNPRNIDVQDFNVENLRYWKWTPDESHIAMYSPDGEIIEFVRPDELDISVTVDLAPAEKINSDRNAVVTVGITPRGDAIVLDAWAKRCTPLAVMDKLFELQDRYQPGTYGIEGVAYQKAFKYFLGAECNRRGRWMHIKEISATGKKEVRIRGLQPVAATGHLYVSPTAHLLRDEMADFPLGEHDDVLDALSMQLQLWPQRLSPEHWMRYAESEKRLMSRIEGYSLKPAPAYDPGDFDPEDDSYERKPNWNEFVYDGPDP